MSPAERTQERLEKLLQATAHDFGLRLTLGDHDAIAGNRLILGIKREEVERAPYLALKGMGLHLLGHYLAPPNEAAGKANALEHAGCPGLARLWHALEDARLENCMLRRWPGMHRAFDANLLPKLGGRRLQRMSTDDQLEIGLYLRGRNVPGASLSPSVLEALESVAAQIVEGANGETPEASLAAIVTIYPKVRHLIRGRGESRRQGPGPEKPSEEARRDASQPGDRSEGPQLPRFEEEEGLFAASPLGLRRPFPEWYLPGSAPWFERGLGEKHIHPAAVTSDRETIVAPPRGDEAAYRSLWLEVQREAGLLWDRLLRALREQAYLRYAGRYRTGKLEMNRLWKQRLGNYRLFQRREESGQRRMAITLLVDESASMQRHGKYKMARKATILLGETLNSLGVSMEIIGFTTAEYEAREAMRLGLVPAHAYRTTRCSRLEHRIYKAFDEPFPLVRTRLAGIQPRHNNWDEEHLLFAFRRIQARPERSRVILVISDGQPNGDANFLVETIAEVERRGLKVIGIGVGEEFVRSIYREAIVVSDFVEMAESLASLLSRELGHGLSRRVGARWPAVPAEVGAG